MLRDAEDTFFPKNKFVRDQCIVVPLRVQTAEARVEFHRAEGRVLDIVAWDAQAPGTNTITLNGRRDTVQRAALTIWRAAAHALAADARWIATHS